MSIFENNRDLLDRFRRGEGQALAEVYERYVDNVAMLARRGFTMESQGHVYVAGAGPDGERELVQDTFLRAFAEKARVSFDGLRPYRPFLLRITKNLMIDRYRARKKEGLREDGAGVGDIDVILECNGAFSIAPDHAENLHWRNLTAATGRFLADLDSESRTLVRLRFEEDLSQDACAAQLGCSRRRIRTLEGRVQKQLRRFLTANKMMDL